LIVGAVREQPLLIFNERFLKADLLEVRRVSGRDIDLFHEPFPSSPPRTSTSARPGPKASFP
jgi:hypothetical protein